MGFGVMLFSAYTTSLFFGLDTHRAKSVDDAQRRSQMTSTCCGRNRLTTDRTAALGIGAASEVELDGQRIVRLSEGLGHAVAVPARDHNREARRQGGLCEIGAHATAAYVLGSLKTNCPKNQSRD